MKRTEIGSHLLGGALHPEYKTTKLLHKRERLFALFNILLCKLPAMNLSVTPTEIRVGY